MALPTKPSDHLDWTDGDVSKVTEPSGPKKLLGLIVEAIPFQWFNWIFWQTDNWNKYYEKVTDPYRSQYAAIVGGTGSNNYPATSAGLQAAISSVSAGDTVLVLSSIAMDALVQISTQCKIELHPRVVLSKGVGGTLTGIQVSASRVEIEGGKMSGFSGGSDIAILVDAGSTFCRVGKLNFASCTTPIDDSAGNVFTYSNITES